MLIALLLSLVWAQVISAGIGNRLWPQPTERAAYVAVLQLAVLALCLFWANFIAFYCFSNRADLDVIKVAPLELQLCLIVFSTCPLFWKVQEAFLTAHRHLLKNDITLSFQLRYTTAIYAGLALFISPLIQQALFSQLRLPFVEAQFFNLINWGMMLSLLPMAAAANLVIMVIMDFKPQSLADFETTMQALKFLNSPEFNEERLLTESEEMLKILEEHAVRLNDHEKARMIAGVRLRGCAAEKAD